MSERPRFSLKRKQMEISLENEDGVDQTYFIKELSGDDRDSYFNTMQSKIKIGPDGQGTVKDFKGLHSDILSLTLFDHDHKKVPAKTIQTFPASTQESLALLSLKLSGIGQKADEVKNDSQASDETGTS